MTNFSIPFGGYEPLLEWLETTINEDLTDKGYYNLLMTDDCQKVLNKMMVTYKTLLKGEDMNLALTRREISALAEQVGFWEKNMNKLPSSVQEIAPKWEYFQKLYDNVEGALNN